MMQKKLEPQANDPNEFSCNYLRERYLVEIDGRTGDVFSRDCSRKYELQIITFTESRLREHPKKLERKVKLFLL